MRTLGSFKRLARAMWIFICACASGCTPGPGGPEADAATPGLTLGGCADPLFVDRTAPAADRTIWFGGQGPSLAFTYAPQCMLVAAGQTVTFSGAFALHPLAPGISSSPDLGLNPGSPNNPIPATAAGQTIAVTLPQAGTYPYFCRNHSSYGMIGAIRVR